MHTPNLYLTSGLSEVASALTMFERDSSNKNICLLSMQNLNFIYVNVAFNGLLFSATPLIAFLAPILENELKYNYPSSLTLVVSFKVSSTKPILILSHPINGLLNVQVTSYIKSFCSTLSLTA